MEKFEPLFTINIFGYPFGVTSSLLIQWIIILILTVFSILVTRGLKKVPDKRQSALEILVDTVNKLVRENMGEKYMNFVPYIGTLMIFLLCMNMVGLFGFKPPTLDFSVVLGVALVTFIVIQANTISKKGLLHYFTGYAEPYAFLLPINVLERFMLPVSLSLRLFGNMTAAVTIMELVYSALGSLSWFAQLGIPIPLHIYFDLFDGTIQMVIFSMLTMIQIKVTAEH